MPICILLLTPLLVLSDAMGEYRAYQYLISSKDPYLAREGAESYVTSALPPSSFLSYHGGGSSVNIELIRTWVCPGHTGHFKPVCDSPYQALQLTAGDIINSPNDNNQNVIQE